jgi:hypothetical protein
MHRNATGRIFPMDDDGSKLEKLETLDSSDFWGGRGGGR